MCRSPAGRETNTQSMVMSVCLRVFRIHRLRPLFPPCADGASAQGDEALSFVVFICWLGTYVYTLV